MEHSTMKDPAAVALGKRRALTLTAQHQAAAGRAAMAALTPEERVRRAVKGAATKKRQRISARRSSKIPI